MCLVSFLSHLYEDQQAKEDIAIKGTRQEQLIILYVVYNTMIMWMKLLYIVVIKANETKTTLTISIADCLVWWHVSLTTDDVVTTTIMKEDQYKPLCCWSCSRL